MVNLIFRKGSSSIPRGLISDTPTETAKTPPGGLDSYRVFPRTGCTELVGKEFTLDHYTNTPYAYLSKAGTFQST